MHSAEILRNARPIFHYLYLQDSQIEKSDLIIGFGHFSLKIPEQCAKLYLKGLSDKLLFTGGRGAGSADFNEAEAIEFSKVIEKTVPGIAGNIIIESGSTNTGENISFSETILKNLDPNFCLENGIQNVIAVASPYRQRRVYLTLKKSFPHLKIFNLPPNTTFEDEINLFHTKNEDFIQLLLGELERIMFYPQKGFIEQVNIPAEIEKNFITLKQLFLQS
jgi:hypothetical protein